MEASPDITPVAGDAYARAKIIPHDCTILARGPGTQAGSDNVAVIPAHRAMLSINSMWFYRRFGGGDTQIDLTKYDSNVVADIIGSIYSRDNGRGITCTYQHVALALQLEYPLGNAGANHKWYEKIYTYILAFGHCDRAHEAVADIFINHSYKPINAELEMVSAAAELWGDNIAWVIHVLDAVIKSDYATRHACMRVALYIAACKGTPDPGELFNSLNNIGWDVIGAKAIRQIFELTTWGKKLYWLDDFRAVKHYEDTDDSDSDSD